MNVIHSGKISKPLNYNSENYISLERIFIETELLRLGCKYFENGVIKPTNEVQEKDKKYVDLLLQKLK